MDLGFSLMTRDSSAQSYTPFLSSGPAILDLVEAQSALSIVGAKRRFFQRRRGLPGGGDCVNRWASPDGRTLSNHHHIERPRPISDVVRLFVAGTDNRDRIH